jgi:hypothetical protein
MPAQSVGTIARVLLSGRNELLSRFSFQFQPVGLADVLGFFAFRRELGIGLLGMGFEQLFYLFAAIHGGVCVALK